MTKVKQKTRSSSKVIPLRRTVGHSRHPILRSAGGAATAGVALVQPALKVGAANDPLEREAENTAARIVSMPAPEMAAPAATPPGSGQAKDGIRTAQRASIEDQPSTEVLEAVPPIPADHQDPDVPKEEDVETTGLTADDMAEIESGEPEDTAGAAAAEEAPPPSDDEAPEEPTAQPARSEDAATVGAEGGAAPADVTRRVAQPGVGRPLPVTVRAFMEPRFGKDFSDVRIHDAPEDRRAARRIGARAFTHRQHIWIGPGETVQNRRLMAHELTHVVQQTKRSPVRVVEREVETSEEGTEPEVRRGYIANKVEKYARKVPGYRLVSVILGKSPITGDRVERNATNLLGALMAMIPGGGVLFDRLMETRVIQNAFDWVAKRLHSLNITWTRIKSLIGELIDYMPARPSKAIRKAKSLFGPIVRDILTFIREVKDKILEFIVRGALKLAGPWAEKVWGVIQRAGGVISTILKDPLGFAKNLFRSVLKGFGQFKDRVLTHIKKGLLGWLFGAMQGLEIQVPEKLDFKGLLSVGLQLVGLTYAKFREKLVKRLGANGERKVAYLERSVEVVKILVKEGFVGLWQRVLQMIDNFKQTVVGGIQKFVIETLIKGGLGWLAGLSNPVGAIVKVVLAIYNIVKTFLERLDQIAEVAESIFSSIGAIAAGKIQQAANFIEKTIAATIPVVISFLAALVPVTGITNSIRGIIKKLKTPVDKAINKMITFLVKKAKKLFSKVIGKLNKNRKLPSADFKIGKVKRQIFAEKKGKSAQVMISFGKGQPIEHVDTETKAEAKKLKGEEAKKIGGAISGEVSEADDETEKAEKKVNLGSKNKNQNKNLKALKAEIDEAAKELTEAGKGAATNPEVDEHVGGNSPLFRFREPRSANIEGQFGLYKDMRRIVEKSENETGRKGGSFYEVDHIVEKQIPKAMLENLGLLDPDKSTRAATTFYRVAERKQKGDLKTVAEKQTKGAKPFGKIGTPEHSKIGEGASHFPAIVLYRPNHRDKDSMKRGTVKSWIEEASKQEDPQSFMRKKLRAQLNKEREDVAKAYQGDKDASAEIGQKVNEGLAKLQPMNEAIYGLGEAEAHKISDASQKDANAKAKSNLGFDAEAGSEQPNFAEEEGRYAPYAELTKGLGKYLEKDHIVEKSFPLKAKQLTFGEKPIWRQITSVKPPGDGKKRGSVDDLREQRVHPKGDDVSTYSEGSGKALLMYRPIHRAVSAASPAAKSAKDLLPDAEAPAVSSAAQAYIESGDKAAAVEKIRNAIQPGIRKKVMAATEAHSRKVESEYDHEIKNVRAANSEGGPEAQTKAAAEMQTIINKVKSNLRQARAYTLDLFS